MSPRRLSAVVAVVVTALAAASVDAPAATFVDAGVKLGLAELHRCAPSRRGSPAPLPDGEQQHRPGSSAGELRADVGARIPGREVAREDKRDRTAGLMCAPDRCPSRRPDLIISPKTRLTPTTPSAPSYVALETIAPQPARAGQREVADELLGRVEAREVTERCDDRQREGRVDARDRHQPLDVRTGQRDTCELGVDDPQLVAVKVQLASRRRAGLSLIGRELLLASQRRDRGVMCSRAGGTPRGGQNRIGGADHGTGSQLGWS